MELPLQLQGHLSELQFQVDLLHQAAHSTHKILSEYIRKFLQSGDPDFVRQGELMEGIIQRWQLFSEAYSKINHSGAYEKPFIFFRYLDASVVKETYTSFQFGIPMSIEGGVYALLGICTGYLLYSFVVRLVFRPSIVN